MFPSIFLYVFSVSLPTRLFGGGGQIFFFETFILVPATAGAESVYPKQIV